MNSHNLVIYELDELYKIFEEIRKDINFNFEKINKQELLKLNSSSKCLILTKNDMPIGQRLNMIYEGVSELFSRYSKYKAMFSFNPNSIKSSQ